MVCSTCDYTGVKHYLVITEIEQIIKYFKPQTMNSKFQLFSMALVAMGILYASKVNAQCSEFYGTTSEGGNYNAGVVFKTDDGGNNLHVVYTAVSTEGKAPCPELCETGDGKIYGITTSGGKYGAGVIFQWDPATNAYIKKFDFTGKETGYSPLGSMMLADNGKMYGTTSDGGTYYNGVLFEWDLSSDTYTKKFEFDGQNGRSPWSSLIQAKNGKLYGMTCQGGSYNNGVIFEWDIDKDTLITKIDLNGTDRGGYPSNSSLMQASNGILYGMTFFGGNKNFGILFEWDPETNIFTKRVDFNGTEKGVSPQGSLIQAANGKLYGMVTFGGKYDKGVLFEYDIETNTFTKKYDYSEGLNGFCPHGTLMQADNGKLYGMASNGGEYGYGVLFEWNLSTDTYTKIFDFDGAGTGRHLIGTLLQAKNGRLYGTTCYGGTRDQGVLFEWDLLTEKFKKKFDFDASENGRNFTGSLIRANNGMLYGMSLHGGIYDQGTLFELNPATDTYTKKYDFDGLENGKLPYGSMVQASNGKLYGLTSQGGLNGLGILFEWNPLTDTYTKKLDFNYSNGANPRGSLLSSGNGKLYGMTLQGGNFGAGVLFEWDPVTDTYGKELDFNQTENGGYPLGSLCEASTGMLYGMTYDGDISVVLFEWDPERNVFHKRLNFPGPNVGELLGSQMQSCNGKLYGMVNRGGTSQLGVLFEWDLNADTCSKIISFSGSQNGSSPSGSLTQGSDGKLYGMTMSGGIHEQGILFAWEPSADTIHKITDFDKTVNGSFPGGELLEVYYDSTSGSMFAEDCRSFVSPSGRYTWTSSGVFTDFLTSSSGCDSVVTVHLQINSSKSLVDAVLCDSAVSPSGKYTWRTYGVYRDTLPNSVGCDSLITVNLHENNLSIINPAVCDTFISPSGKNAWGISGVYSDTIPSTTGCDSIITINLTVNRVDTSINVWSSEILVSNNFNAAYQWVDCDKSFTPLEGEAEQGYEAKTSGNYAVIVTFNGCVDTSSCYYLTVTGLLENTFKDDISLYPNPTDGSLSVNLGKAYSKVVVIITDTKGRIIQQENMINAKSIQLKMNTPPGIYMVIIASENERAVFKVIRNQ
jgi:uncharacterized repeat protein (TIGR03803 family)